MGYKPVELDVETMDTELARLISEQGRKKGWVADQLGISKSRLSRLITGERDMTLQEAARAARIFGVPVETFLPTEEEHDDQANG